MAMFPDLTPAEIERLALLAEELGEAIQAIGKILRHGYASTHPDGGPNNAESLASELGDVFLAVELLEDAGDLDRSAILVAQNDKRERVGRYLHHQPEGLLR